MILFISIKFLAALTTVLAFLISLAEPQCNPQTVVHDTTTIFEFDQELGICRDDQFECRNGECIDDQFLCDGRADCSDQSDETRSECSKPELICPRRSYRCDYGACVHENAVCNGVRDCLDNSDELLAECPRPSLKRRRLIFSRFSDESDQEKTPAQRKIPRGTRDRIRGRTPVLPGGQTGISRPLRPSTSQTPISDVNPLISLMYSFCIVPPQPLNGRWRLHRRFCQGDEDCDIPQGVALKPGSQLLYSCDAEFRVKGNTDVFCGSGGKWSRIPVCIASTCTPLNSVSRAATCSRFGERVSCLAPILPLTRAKVTCRVNYGLESQPVPTLVEQDVECNQNGRWEPEPITCQPICGVENRSGQKRVTVDGVSVEAGGFPWHANLWKEIVTARGSELEFRCSATIVQPNFVLTAAHCVLDEISGVQEDPTVLRVTAGNIYRDPNDIPTVPWIVQKVKNVYRYCEYYGLVHSYASDIALIELSQPFETSAVILPACLDVSSQSEQNFKLGVVGKIDGFGRNSIKESSPMLQTLKVSHVSNSECRTPYKGFGNEVVVNNDEFCGAYSNDTTVCGWDTGGGLVVEKDGLWHLMGIYSVGLRLSAPTTGTNCRDNPYSLYTKISAYMPWIQDVFFQLERYKSYPVCRFYVYPPALTTTVTSTLPPSVTWNMTWDTSTSSTPPPTTTSTSTSTPTPTPTPLPTPMTTTTTTTTSTTTSTPIEMRMPPDVGNMSCLVPSQPANGEWKLLCPENERCNVPEGAALGPGSQLVYSCLPGFRINGSADVYCGLQGRWSSKPTCNAITCPSLESPSRSVSCYQLNHWTPCGSSSLPNITASLSCRSAFTEDASLPNAGSKSVTCNITCSLNLVSVCGLTNTALTPTVLNGTAADITEFPWHATLYKQKRASQDPKEFQCGATIIQENLLLTAAHCVYNDAFNTVEEPEKFHVVTGNKFRDYDSKLHDSRVVQKAAVKNIYVPCSYRGLEGNYNSDIAIIELRMPFQLSGILIPACMDVLGNNEQILETGSVGRFAGFGRTQTGLSSATLLTTKIPYVSYRQCKMSDSPEENIALIGNDKFCGGNRDGTGAVCQGDSGGGLVFEAEGKWNVMGILSVNLGTDTSNGERTCDGKTYSLYTKVSSHMSWIRHVMYNIEHSKTSESCGSE
ncbi:uncharacterized protein LOC124413661 [Diprion similis]|uniref:uncharacterized protein LOC124413661 n=1 Tax=Diprion similis TaxID=362088 RepID=UPI001EF93A4C|nr:uncharacterized protein LOC124413661 [Diprion similis]